MYKEVKNLKCWIDMQKTVWIGIRQGLALIILMLMRCWEGQPQILAVEAVESTTSLMLVIAQD